MENNVQDLIIENVNENEAHVLTEIAFEAKKHWNYPNHFYDIWKEELTITPGYIEKNIVNKAVFCGEIVGFYAIVENKSDFWSGEVFVQRGFWLEHIFVKPNFHNQGIGIKLIEHAKIEAHNRGVEHLLIFADPNARGFYDKMGASFLSLSKSSIADRLIPIYELKTGL
ncbi:MAG: GNAT family N-acetyltransferase [Bacteroidales bacterium]|nr:GNAT family N-acetyltransferase [Bacteroidales bacterium]